MFRQAIFGRLTGYEDVNDALRRTGRITTISHLGRGGGIRLPAKPGLVESDDDDINETQD